MKRNKRFIFWTLAILVLLIGGGYAVHRANAPQHQEAQTKQVKKKAADKKKQHSTSTKKAEQADKVEEDAASEPQSTPAAPVTEAPITNGQGTTGSSVTPTPPSQQQGSAPQVNPEDMEPNAFIANPATMTYYRTGQQPSIPDASWVYFDSETQAQAAGYHRG